MQNLCQLLGATTDAVNVVNLLGIDAPFVNNYGVWEDEFTELGLAHTLEYTWPDAVCYFGEGSEVFSRRLCICHLPDSVLPMGCTQASLRPHCVLACRSNRDTQPNVCGEQRRAHSFTLRSNWLMLTFCIMSCSSV